MCFNLKVSLFTFIVGMLGSLLLIKYGNPKYKIENLVFGIFLMFISGIQLMDFLFWIDLYNKIGINHITTLIGPLYNVGHPVVLYLIKLLFCNHNNASNFTNVGMLILNALYVVYLGNMYKNFITQEKSLTTSTNKTNGHLEWKWLKYANPFYYTILLAINIFYLTDFKYSLFLFLITYLFLYLSYTYFSYSAGEIWCFFGVSIPLFMILF